MFIRPVYGFLISEMDVQFCVCREDVFDMHVAGSHVFICLVGKPYIEELLLASVSQGRLQVLRSIICVS